MTYEDVVLRMIRPIYVAHEFRWVDISLPNLAGDWLRRVEERFVGVDGKPKASILQSYTSLDSSTEFVKTFFETYAKATKQFPLPKTSLTSSPSHNDPDRNPFLSSLYWSPALKSGSRKYVLVISSSNAI